MKYLYCRNHEIVLVEIKSDKDNKEKNIYTEYTIPSLLSYLGFTIKIGKDFTLRDLFRYINKTKFLLQCLFSGPLGSFPLGDFFKEIGSLEIEKTSSLHTLKPEQLLSSSNTEDNVMVGLEFYKVAELHNYSDEQSFSVYTDFGGYGWRKPFDSEKTKKIQTETFSIGFSPLNTIADLPLRIKDTVLFTEWKDIKKNAKPPFIVHKNLDGHGLILWEILYAIFFEMTFYGSPAKRNQEAERITKISQDIKSGKEKTYSFSQIEKSFAKMRKIKDKKDKKDKKASPGLIKKYNTLLKNHKDEDAFPVRKFYVENSNNSFFTKAVNKNVGNNVK